MSEIDASEGELEVEGSDPEEEERSLSARLETLQPYSIRFTGFLDDAGRDDHEEARHRHETNVAELARLRAHRDHLNELIRIMVRNEDLSRRALTVYDKAAEGS